MRLESGGMLIESAAILDHYDEIVEPSMALIPASGDSRREALQVLAIATGAIDRSMAANAERRRAAPEPARLERLLRGAARDSKRWKISLQDAAISTVTGCSKPISPARLALYS